MELPILTKPWICLDTETTGLTKWDDVLQFSAITSSGEEIDEYFNGRRQKKWKKSEVVHGITPEFVKDKDTFYSRRLEFRNILKSYPLILGYNISFDLKMIYSGIFYDVLWSSGVIDVYHLWNLYRKKHKINLENNKLTTVSRHLGYNFDEIAHNSLEDVRATIYVFSKIIEDDEFFELVISVSKGEQI